MTEPFRQRKVQCLAPGGLHRMAYLEWGDAANPQVLICVPGVTPCAPDFDFLAQEFNREANALCAKASDVQITRAGLALKTVIDQMREQVQNIE